jgi:hypothetical protein
MLFAADQARLRRIGEHLQRIVDLLVGPQATHRHDAVGDLADRAEILVPHVGRVRPILAIPRLIEDQRSCGMRLCQRRGPQQLDLARRHRLRLPRRLAQEELQLLDWRGLRLRDRLRPNERGQRLVAIARQEQASQVLAEASALDVGVEQVVEGVGILLERQRHAEGVARRRHRFTSFHTSPNEL